MSVRPAKTQISLGIRPVLTESSLCAQWVAKDPSILHADAQADLGLPWAHTHFVRFLSCRGSNIVFGFPSAISYASKFIE